jgi:hypothetical protein
MSKERYTVFRFLRSFKRPSGNGRPFCFPYPGFIFWSMKPALLRLSRQFAWTAALGALVVMGVGYEALPDQIPLTRWTTGSRTPLLVLRVPLINLFCLFLIHILDGALARAHGATPFRDHAMRVAAILYATVGLKSFLEALELLVLPEVLPGLLPILLFAVLAGLAGVIVAGRG